MPYKNCDLRPANGLCRDCPSTVFEGRILCDKCRAAYNLRAKEKGYRKDWHKNHPEEHRIFQYERKRRLMAAGLCKHCADARTTYESECDRCHNKRMAARRKK